MTTPTFEDFQKFSKQQLDAVNAAAASVAKGLQEIAAESSDYSKKAFASSSATVEKLLGAKSVETAVQIQTDYAKSTYEGFVAQANKINEIYIKLATEAFKPVEAAFTKLQVQVNYANGARAKRGRVAVLTCQGRRRAGPFLLLAACRF